MDAIGASAIAYRDLLRFVLPAMFGGCLFLPLLRLWNINISANAIVFASLIGGYIVYTPVAWLSSNLQDWIPRGPLSLSKSRARDDWWRQNWDYDEMWAHLDKDERDYVYMTQAYLEFYQSAGFYFFAYGVANLCFALWAFSHRTVPEAAKFFQTPIFGHETIPWWFAVCTGLFFGCALFGNVVLEYDAIYGDNGQYVGFARRCHTRDGGIARSIWGRVRSVPNRKTQDVNIALLRDGLTVAIVKADSDGWYQFVDAFSLSSEQIVQTTVVGSSVRAKSLLLRSNTIPELDIALRDLSASAPQRSTDMDRRLVQIESDIDQQYRPLQTSVDRIAANDEILGSDLRWRRIPGDHLKVGCIYRETLDGPMRRRIT